MVCVCVCACVCVHACIVCESMCVCNCVYLCLCRWLCMVLYSQSHCCQPVYTISVRIASLDSGPFELARCVWRGLLWVPSSFLLMFLAPFGLVTGFIPSFRLRCPREACVPYLTLGSSSSQISSSSQASSTSTSKTSPNSPNNRNSDNNPQEKADTRDR